MRTKALVLLLALLALPASAQDINNPQTNASALTTGTLPAARLPSGALANSLGADVALNVTANYFDGPVVAQGSVGTWFASGTVTLTDTTGTGGNNFLCKLWDGTTIIDSSVFNLNSTAANFFAPLTLSGFITSPTGNIRISCRNTIQTTAKIVFNQSGNSKDSTITVYRIN